MKECVSVCEQVFFRAGRLASQVLSPMLCCQILCQTLSDCFVSGCLASGKMCWLSAKDATTNTSAQNDPSEHNSGPEP